jgi:uncharacterized protein (TIGR00369 family)
MSATTEPRQELLERTRERVHPYCIICGSQGHGLHLHFRLLNDGSVQAEFPCPVLYQGYDRILHGGVTSSLLDAAMTNCLFAHGISALTAEMTVRFRHPIAIGQQVTVRARLHREQKPLYVVEASLMQSAQTKAIARGKFMVTPEMAEP